MEKFYEEAGMTPDVIADAVLYALSQPESIDVCDLVIRSGKEALVSPKNRRRNYALLWLYRRVLLRFALQ